MTQNEFLVTGEIISVVQMRVKASTKEEAMKLAEAQPRELYGAPEFGWCKIEAPYRIEPVIAVRLVAPKKQRSG